MEHVMVTGIIATLRSCLNSSTIQGYYDSFESYDEVLKYIRKFAGDQKISNSESLLLAAIYGAHEMGLDTRILNLNDYFRLDRAGTKNCEGISNALMRTTGWIISSPVYFGDTTCLVTEMISFIRRSVKSKSLPLDGKAVGIVSVGAKRNGGQETTNIYTLYDCLNLGASIVGNGPPSSQYGGTGWGGNIGKIVGDNEGFETSKGTGSRVGMLSKIVNFPDTAAPIRILVLITRRDKEKRFVEKVRSIPFSKNTHVDILDITDLRIRHCMACTVCPKKDFENDYRCAIPPGSCDGEVDDMMMVRDHLIKSDAIIVAHYAGEDAERSKYHAFMERTRFIRRNDFELADRVFSVFFETNSLMDISPVRFMTHFLRQNVFIIGPFYECLQIDGSGGFRENIGVEAFAKRIEEMTRKASMARKDIFKDIEYYYEPVGYT